MDIEYCTQVLIVLTFYLEPIVSLKFNSVVSWVELQIEGETQLDDGVASVYKEINKKNI